jgi:hypothetical protein
MTKLKDGPGEENNPIVQYQEWADHRYNSGHWLGGNVPPSTRNFWSGINRRWLGAAYLGASVVGALFAFRTAKNSVDLVYALLALSIYFIPGAIMLLARNLKKRKKAKSEIKADDAHKAAGHHHGHGRYSDR